MKKILIALFVLVIIIQFFPIDKTNPPVNKQMDFITIKNTPESTAKLIETSCYDCHSNESKYPWYSNISPISWFLKSHIDEARKELNFSEFAMMEPLKQAKKLNKSAKEVEEGEMPLESYLLIHQDAKLNDVQKKELAAYFVKVKDEIMQNNNITDDQVNAKSPKRD